MKPRTESQQEISLEEKLFQLIQIISIAMAFFWLLYRLFYFKNTTLIIIHSCSTTTFTVLYIVYKRTRNFEITSLIYYLVLLVFLILGYFPSGGSHGTTLFFSVIAFCMGILVLPQKFTFIFSAFFVIITIMLGMLEYIFPDLVPIREVRQTITLSKIMIHGIIFMILGTFLYYYKKEYAIGEQKRHYQNAALRKEKKQLELSERIKTKLLRTITQELNAPVKGIDHLVHKIKKQAGDSDLQQLLYRLNKHNELLKNILTDVLELSGSGQGNATLKQEHFNLRTELDELIDLLENNAEKSHAIYRLNTGEGIPGCLSGDALRLKQALSSLINSSIYFMKGNEVVISVDRLFVVEQKCTIRFAINCRGASLSKRMKAELFERFYNEEKYSLDDPEIGLDLVMPKKLIESLGGNIIFTFDRRNDFTYTFDLPFGLCRERGL